MALCFIKHKHSIKTIYRPSIANHLHQTQIRSQIPNYQVLCDHRGITNKLGLEVITAAATAVSSSSLYKFVDVSDEHVLPPTLYQGGLVIGVNVMSSHFPEIYVNLYQKNIP
jgi:hypothetical protein